MAQVATNAQRQLLVAAQSEAARLGQAVPDWIGRRCLAAAAGRGNRPRCAGTRRPIPANNGCRPSRSGRQPIARRRRGLRERRYCGPRWRAAADWKTSGSSGCVAAKRATRSGVPSVDSPSTTSTSKPVAVVVLAGQLREGPLDKPRLIAHGDDHADEKRRRTSVHRWCIPRSRAGTARHEWSASRVRDFLLRPRFARQ